MGWAFEQCRGYRLSILFFSSCVASGLVTGRLVGAMSRLKSGGLLQAITGFFILGVDLSLRL